MPFPRKGRMQAESGSSGSRGKRQLVRWDHDLDTLLLLTVQSACNTAGIKVPWDKVAELMGPKFTEGAIVQHLSKLRIRREAAGQRVPPPLRRSATAVAAAAGRGSKTPMSLGGRTPRKRKAQSAAGDNDDSSDGLGAQEEDENDSDDPDYIQNKRQKTRRRLTFSTPRKSKKNLGGGDNELLCAGAPFLRSTDPIYGSMEFYSDTENSDEDAGYDDDDDDDDEAASFIPKTKAQQESPTPHPSQSRIVKLPVTIHATRDATKGTKIPTASKAPMASKASKGSKASKDFKDSDTSKDSEESKDLMSTSPVSSLSCSSTPYGYPTNPLLSRRDRTMINIAAPAYQSQSGWPQTSMATNHAPAETYHKPAQGHVYWSGAPPVSGSQIIHSNDFIWSQYTPAYISGQGGNSSVSGTQWGGVHSTAAENSAELSYPWRQDFGYSSFFDDTEDETEKTQPKQDTGRA